MSFDVSARRGSSSTSTERPKGSHKAQQRRDTKVDRENQADEGCSSGVGRVEQVVPAMARQTSKHAREV